MRRVPRFAAVVLSVAGSVALAGVTAAGSNAAPVPPTGARRAAPNYDWTTYHGTRSRSGFAASMPVVQGHLGIAAHRRLDASVYASPIVAGGRTIVATERNSVYAFDASGRELWTRHLGKPSPQSERPCGNIDPLGITGTPVYSARTGIVYVAAEFTGARRPRHTLIGLSARTGRVIFRRHLDLPGADPRVMQERGALTISHGRVYVPFGGLAGDCGDYKGRVVGYVLSGRGAPVQYTVPTAREAGIWTPPGPSVDAAGNLYVAVGNGASGVGDAYDHSDSVLKLSPGLDLVSSFSPTTWPTDNDADLDLGSQGPTLVGRRWVFSAGKSGTAYVLRQTRLGGIGGEVSQSKLCTSFGGTAVVGDVVYVPCTDGLRAVRIERSGRLHVLWHATSRATGSPVVGGDRIWTLDPGSGTLLALGITRGHVRNHIHVGATSRFATPALSGHYVIVGNLYGVVTVHT